MADDASLREITSDTCVTFPGGSISEESTVIWAGNCRITEDREAGVVLTETSPFHPLDHTWPDQPGDTGLIHVGDRSLQVHDTITGGLLVGSEDLAFGSAISVRRGEGGWTFVVAHIVDPDESLSDLIGKSAHLRVDAERRKLLSASHSACHVMALALNLITRDMWRKEVIVDSLGNPNFDQLAIIESRMTIGESRDRYRLGKSVRKKGFDSELFFGSIDKVAKGVEAQMLRWICAETTAIEIEAPTLSLSAVRIWKCTLPEGIAMLPCGGTHLLSLGQLSEVAIAAERPTSEPEVTMVTRPRLAD